MMTECAAAFRATCGINIFAWPCFTLHHAVKRHQTQAMFCPNCGTEISSEAKYCFKCGVGKCISIFTNSFLFQCSTILRIFYSYNQTVVTILFYVYYM